jgi:hypothetical protein
LPDAAYCGEKYEGDVVAVETWLGVNVVGVEGLVNRRLRDTDTEAAELVEGRRRSGEGSVYVR